MLKILNNETKTAYKEIYLAEPFKCSWSFNRQFKIIIIMG